MGLQAALEQVRAASDADQVLDGVVWKLLSEREGDVWRQFDDGVWMLQDANDTVAYEMPPPLTASVDAALRYVTLRLPYHLWVVESADDERGCRAALYRGDMTLDGEAYKRTPPLAIIEALLVALIKRATPN